MFTANLRSHLRDAERRALVAHLSALHAAANREFERAAGLLAEAEEATAKALELQDRAVTVEKEIAALEDVT